MLPAPGAPRALPGAKCEVLNQKDTIPESTHIRLSDATESVQWNEPPPFARNTYSTPGRQQIQPLISGLLRGVHPSPFRAAHSPILVVCIFRRLGLAIEGFVHFSYVLFGEQAAPSTGNFNFVKINTPSSTWCNSGLSRESCTQFVSLLLARIVPIKVNSIYRGHEVVVRGRTI